MNSKRGLVKIYWDTCVFLAWIKDENQPDDVKKGIEQTIEQAYSGEVVIVTSTITLTEALQTKMTPDQKTRYQQAFRNSRLQLVDVDRRIASRAATLREHYDTRVFDAKGVLSRGSFMSLGDSLHIATALHIDVREMHTLDGSGKRQHRLDLLKLNGDVAGARLRIVKPSYVPPPKHLEGPIKVLAEGPQMKLLPEEDNGKKQEPVPSPAPVQGSAAGSAPGAAGAEVEAAKAQGEGDTK